MIELRTLGRLELRQDGHDVPAVLKQPKRLALLAYLGASTPRRFHRRDSLLALFWPDLDASHARAALRRAIYFLRKALGDTVIAGRGDEEIAVDEAGFWCDAAAFELALAEGKLEAALRLYQGDLLEGFFVTQASEFERWLDQERVRLRDRAAAAARQLAGRQEQDGRLQGAVEWARRETDLAPFDEGAARRLVTLLERQGDRAAALHAYDSFAARIRSAYDIDPSPETRALADRIRTQAPAAPLRTPPAPEPARDNSTIAVLPFPVRGNPDLSYLEEGMVDLLSTKLDGAGELRTVDPRALLGFLAHEGNPGPDPDTGRKVAARFGAGRFILGSVIEAGGRLQLTASLFRSDGAGSISQVETRGAGETDVFSLVDELARRLLAGEQGGPAGRVARLAALTTGSLPALRAYLAGERDLRLGRFFDAMEALQRATAEDPAFALAYYRLAAASAASAMIEPAREAADRAHRHRERLGPHDRLLLDAQRAWLAGAAGTAESLYRTIVGHYPDDVEAWYLLGDLQMHSNPLRGRSVTEARHAFEQALTLDPDLVSALVHLVRISAIEGNAGARDRYLARVLDLSPGGERAVAMRALAAFAHRDAAAEQAVIEELKQARAVTVAVAFSDVALYADNLEGASRVGRAFLEVVRSDDLRALIHIMLAHVAAARGEWNDATRELTTATRLEPAWGLEVQGLFAALPFVPWTTDEIRRIRDALAAWDAAAVTPSMNPAFAVHNELHPHLRAYLRGLLDARLGDLDAASAARTVLSTLPPPQGQEIFVRNLELSLESAIARAQGDAARALAALEAMHSDIWFQFTVTSPFFCQALDRHARAALLEQAGRTDEAERWRACLAERSPYELIVKRTED
ncbi:MAG: BTAD domain-containing putative transcriptional regulator [Gemmatimonadales bacterium]